MILHALKHHQQPVCGLLVGPEDTKSGKQDFVLCADAMPLLHTHMLHPQLRLGVELVEAMCEMDQSDGGAFRNLFAPNCKYRQKIVGFYYSDFLTVPEKAPTMNKEATHIARVLRQHYPNLLVCTFWVPSGSSWTRIPPEAVSCSKAALKLAEVAVTDRL
ncbi:uncharacterized protein LOC34623452 [Cyclospora cayetanensis]|uniref:Uncharacterized protein LOC34623452 n=1 Tax=Cyclospora cayetanensis TaxID=88456 RepID=A0A6P6RWP0_9EIME|nr:uncharacterized protein LOC34623452 [Cyclospora cayetanensis]